MLPYVKPALLPFTLIPFTLPALSATVLTGRAPLLVDVVPFAVPSAKAPSDTVDAPLLGAPLVGAPLVGAPYPKAGLSTALLVPELPLWVAL